MGIWHSRARTASDHRARWLRRAIRPAAVTAVCAALAVAGCSSSGSANSAGTPGGASSSSATSSGQAMSASQVLALAASKARRVNSVTATMEIWSSGNLTSHVTGTLEEQIRPALLGRQTFTGSSGGTPLPGSLQTLLTAKAVYLKISSLAHMLGKPWVEIPFSSLKHVGLNLAPIVHQLQSSNPLAEEQMLPGAVNVRQAGSQTVNGVATTEYDGAIRVATALAHLQPAMRELLQPAYDATGVTAIRFKVWVDAQHTVRKLAEVLTGSGNTISSVVVITSINKPVSFQVPPASQVATMPGL